MPGVLNHTPRLFFGIVVVIGAIYLISCNEKPYSSSPETRPDRYPLESEPALSPDHSYICYITTDTADHANNGIYRARSTKPVREPVFLGSGLYSPSMSLSGNIIAFLKYGFINYYRISDSLRWSSTVAQLFKSALCINDSLTIAGRSDFSNVHDSLFLVNENAETAEFLTTGYDPAFAATGSFVYFARLNSRNYAIVRNDISGDNPDTLLVVNVDNSMARPRWPTLETSLGRIAFIVTDQESKTVYVAAINPDVPGPPVVMPRPLATTWTDKACIISPDKIIFTGPDGRFYESDFNGENIFPYWEAVGSGK